MTLIPSFSVSLIALGVLALLALADWFVSGFSVGVPNHDPGEARPDDFRKRHAHGEPNEFREVA